MPPGWRPEVLCRAEIVRTLLRRIRQIGRRRVNYQSYLRWLNRRSTEPSISPLRIGRSPCLLLWVISHQHRRHLWCWCRSRLKQGPVRLSNRFGDGYLKLVLARQIGGDGDISNRPYLLHTHVRFGEIDRWYIFMAQHLPRTRQTKRRN
jgi:hypothetical protein